MLVKKYGMSEATNLEETWKKTGDEASNTQMPAATCLICVRRSSKYAVRKASVVEITIARTSGR